MKRKIYRILYGIITIGVLYLMVSCTWWKEVWGDHPLGNNLSLLEGDKKEDRVVVYCPNSNGKVCYGGIYVIPTYAKHYDSNNRYAEYVETAKSNEKWVIVKTIQIKEKKENYWIINKNFNIENLNCAKEDCQTILQGYVTGPLSLTEFKNKAETLKIDLEF